MATARRETIENDVTFSETADSVSHGPVDNSQLLHHRAHRPREINARRPDAGYHGNRR